MEAMTDKSEEHLLRAEGHVSYVLHGDELMLLSFCNFICTVLCGDDPHLEQEGTAAKVRECLLYLNQIIKKYTYVHNVIRRV